MSTFLTRGKRSFLISNFLKLIFNLITTCSLLLSNIVTVSALTEEPAKVAIQAPTNTQNGYVPETYSQPAAVMAPRPDDPTKAGLQSMSPISIGNAEIGHVPALLIQPNFAGWNYGCTSGPYDSCSEEVSSKHTSAYRRNFDITYNYGVTRTIFGSNFNLSLVFNTGVYNTNFPIYWNIYPVVNQDMPNRSISVQYSGVSGLGTMSYPSGSWTVPGQPSPYSGFAINFSRATGGPEIFVRTDSWHVSVSTYPLVDEDSFDFSQSDCQCAGGLPSSQGQVGDPINTRTGTFSLAPVDLSVASSAGELAFKRLYSSSAIDKETGLLGYGWTHNQDAKLILPTDPQGQAGYLIFKSDTGNRFRFRIEPNGSYIAGPGVTGSLSLTNNIYTLAGIDQSKYTFDARGQLTARSDARGNVFSYTYNGSNQLTRVSAGQRYIDIQYDASGRITQVSDHTGRHVTYGYDANNNLISVIDTLNQNWQYVYDSNHFLTQSIDPNGHQLVRNAYSIRYSAFSFNFNDFSLEKFGSQDVAPTQAAVEDGGNTLHLKGNTWKSIYFPLSTSPYVITPDTILEFDFKGPVQGEIQGIGLFGNYDSSGEKIFRLYGTETTGGLGYYSDYASSAPGWKHYKIHVGDFYRGNAVMLVFANDHDVSTPTAESYFSNVQLYQDQNQPAPVNVNFNSYTISPFSTQDVQPNTTNVVEDNGATLHISGNSWKKIPFPYLVTLNTVIEFDFKSTAQGEIHGLGFKATEESSASQMFKLYGTESGWNSTYNNYSSSAPQWKHYKIPVGTYYQGWNSYLVFTNDHDISSPTAQSYFSTLVVYEQQPTPTTCTRVTTQYDGLDNPTEKLEFGLNGSTTITDALGNVTGHAYDRQNALVKQTDPLSGDVIKTYDGNYRPQTITDAASHTSTLNWSTNGANLLSVTDSAGSQTSITYNSLNLPTSVTDPRNYLTTFVYSGVNLTGTTNALNQTTTYTYNAQNLLTSVKDPLNQVTSYTYDSHGQRISMTDALNHTWAYAYDSLGRLVDATDPLGHVTHSVYDAAGRLPGP